MSTLTSKEKKQKREEKLRLENERRYAERKDHMREYDPRSILASNKISDPTLFTAVNFFLDYRENKSVEVFKKYADYIFLTCQCHMSASSLDSEEFRFKADWAWNNTYNYLRMREEMKLI